VEQLVPVCNSLILLKAPVGVAQHEIDAGTKGKRARNPYFTGLTFGDPSRTRTCNPRSRNPLLYPVELWDRCHATSFGAALGAGGQAGEPNHGSVHSTVNMKNPLSRKEILRTESDE
jgi:hypothetical protein